jgi:hypothetical protein
MVQAVSELRVCELLLHLQAQNSISVISASDLSAMRPLTNAARSEEARDAGCSAISLSADHPVLLIVNTKGMG